MPGEAEKDKIEVVSSQKLPVSTDQTNKWICSEQHRRPDAPQTLQNETRGRIAEPRRSERTGEDYLLYIY